MGMHPLRVVAARLGTLVSPLAVRRLMARPWQLAHHLVTRGTNTLPTQPRMGRIQQARTQGTRRRRRTRTRTRMHTLLMRMLRPMPKLRLRRSAGRPCRRMPRRQRRPTCHLSPPPPPVDQELSSVSKPQQGLPLPLPRQQPQQCRLVPVRGLGRQPPGALLLHAAAAWPAWWGSRTRTP